MTTSDSTAADFVSVHTRGAVIPAEAEYARTQVRTVLRYAPGPVLRASAKLTLLADPALPRPAVVQVNLDLNGRLVRAQVARATMREAVDEVHDRLRDRLQRAAGNWEAIRGSRPSPDPHEWRRGERVIERRTYFPRPVEERELVRHKAFSLARMSVDEAAFDMAMLDYDFHVFTEEGSGVDSVLYRLDDENGHRLAQVDPRPDDIVTGVTPVTVSAAPAPRLDVAQAIDRLNLTGWPFVFFRDATTDRGCVVYHRYDGHYGLITPAG